MSRVLLWVISNNLNSATNTVGAMAGVVVTEFNIGSRICLNYIFSNSMGKIDDDWIIGM